MKIQEIKKEIIEISKRLYKKNCLVGADGNISYKIKNDQILITNSGKPKAFLSNDDFSIITPDNKIIEGSPSSERLMHLTIYNHCPEAICVLHAHPPTAIAWSIAFPEDKELPSSCLSEVILAIGNVPIIPYARPGTEKMGLNIVPYLPENRAFILARHGALTWGESLDEVSHGMERIEHTVNILKSAIELNKLTELPKNEIIYLKKLRKKLGNKLL